MRRILSYAVIGLVFSFGGFSTPAVSDVRVGPDFSDVVEREIPVVVSIRVSIDPKKAPRIIKPGTPPQIVPPPPLAPPGTPPQIVPPTPEPEQKEGKAGSGFIISSDGYILTNAHVVLNADGIKVRLHNRKIYTATLIGLDERTDVALLKIEGKDFPVAKIGDPNKAKQGQWVLAIGTPYGFEDTVSAGIISAKGRMLPDNSLIQFIQTDVSTNPGNSGGPLFNLDGEVLGINSQIWSTTGGFMGLAFAIPVDSAMKVVEALKKDGKVVRGRIGIHIQELSDEVAKSMKLETEDGALVVGVEQNGPADLAGLKAGDVIMKFNGVAIINSRELPSIVASTKPGESAVMTVYREGQTIELTIVMGELK